MRNYYTRACNFHYGNYAKKLVKSKKALFLAGNSNIAFDQVEIFQRKKKGNVKSNICHINEIKSINKEIKLTNRSLVTLLFLPPNLPPEFASKIIKKNCHLMEHSLFAEMFF